MQIGIVCVCHAELSCLCSPLCILVNRHVHMKAQPGRKYDISIQD